MVLCLLRMCLLVVNSTPRCQLVTVKQYAPSICRTTVFTTYNLPTKMPQQILSDSGDDVHVSRRPPSRRNPVPATKLLDANNLERASLPFQQKAINNYRAARNAQVHDAPIATSSPTPNMTPHAPSPTATQTPTESSPAPSCSIDKRPISRVESSSDESDATIDGGVKLTVRPPKKGL